MKTNRWIAISLLSLVPLCGALALAQTRVSVPPMAPPFMPPTAPQAPENIAVTELRIGLQKAQIQAMLANQVAQVKEDALKALQPKAEAGQADMAKFLDAQADSIAAHAAADTVRIDVASMELQFRAGPAALQQAQSAPPQPGGSAPQASPLMAQLMQMDLQKAHIQATAAAQIYPIKQKIYDLLVAQQKAGTATSDKVDDALLDLEAARAGQLTTALDEQLMTARLAAMGVKK
jgi:hypothetical protein